MVYSVLLGWLRMKNLRAHYLISKDEKDLNTVHIL